MPRPGPRRPLVSFKLDQSAIDWIDRLASERGENRSQTIRALLSYARNKRMPPAWQPLQAVCPSCGLSRRAMPHSRCQHPSNHQPRNGKPATTPRADEPFQCQLGHRQPVMVTDSTYRQHVKRAHRAEARELGWLK